jgi:hypothetical protein
MLLLTMTQTSDNFGKFFSHKVEEKNQRIHRNKIPQGAMRENLCTKNLPLEAMREHRIIQIYRR